MTGISEKDRAGGFTIFITILLCLPFLLKLLYSLPLQDSFIWYCGVLLVFYVPGNLLVRQFAFRDNNFLPRFFCSLALGAAFMPLIYNIFRKLQLPWLMLYFVIGIFLVWFAFFVMDFGKENHFHVSRKDLISFGLLLAFLLLLLHLCYFTDIILDEHGFQIRTSKFTETVFHLGLINNLKDLYPPLYPYASGNNFLYYHLNMHLEIEMFHRLFPIDTLKLTFFYFPFLYFFLLVLMTYALVLEIGGTRVIAIAAGMLLFGSDLSFLIGALAKVPWDYPWISIYNPLIWSVLTLNGILPALILMFLCIFCLYQYDKLGKKSLLVLCCLLGYSAYGFKSSMGFHLIGTLFLTGVASFFIAADKQKGLMLAGGAAVTIIAMALNFIIFTGGTGGPGAEVTLNPFHAFRTSLARIGIAQLPWFSYPPLFLWYSLATFGARLFGFVFAKRVFRKMHFNLVVFFLTVFTISGFLLSEMVSVGNSENLINNSIWFSSQSLFCAWLLVAYFLIEQIKHRKKLLIYVMIIMLVSMPSTVQFLVLRYHSAYHDFNANALEVSEFLEKTPPKSCVLHPLNNEPSLASNFAGRPSVINTFRSFAPLIIGEYDYMRRISSVKSFFSADSLMNRALFLKHYQVDYVYANISYLSLLDKEAMLFQVLKNDEYVVYKVRKKAPDA